MGLWGLGIDPGRLHEKQKSIRMNNTFPIDESVTRVAESVSPSAELQNSLDAGDRAQLKGPPKIQNQS